MRNSQKMQGSKMLLAALFASLLYVGTSQAQAGLPAYALEFTLTSQTRWGGTVLQPGDYTITLGSTAPPAFGIIRTGQGRTVAIVVSKIRNEQATRRSALLLKEKEGQLCVHSLALADLKTVLVYDPALARENGLEARASQTVPVIWAKK